MTKRQLEKEINDLVNKAVEKTVKEQVSKWEQLFQKCNDVAYSADGKITAIWFYLKHPKGFCFRVDRPEGRRLEGNQWTFSAHLLCYFDYVYQGKIKTVTLIEAYGEDRNKYHSAQVYEETDSALRVLICYRDEDGSNGEACWEIEKSTGFLKKINDSEEKVKRYGEADEKETKVRFDDKQ